MDDSGRWLKVSQGNNPGSRPHQSLLHPADPISIGDGTLSINPNNGNRWCVACSINTWEEARKDEESRIFALSVEEQNMGTAHLHCSRCGHHLCNLCAPLFCEKLKSFTKKGDVHPPWCQMAEEFLEKAKSQGPGFVMPASHCFSCEFKALRESNIASTCKGTDMMSSCKVILPWQSTEKKQKRATGKRRRQNDKYQHIVRQNKKKRCYLDGLLFFPTLSIVVRSTTKYFDTLSLAKQVGCGKASPEPALPHMNITPLNAYYLEEHGFSPERSPADVELFRKDVVVSYPHPADPTLTINRTVEVIVVKSQKHPKIPEMGTDWVTGNEVKASVEYLSDDHIQKALERSIDVVAIFAAPTKKGGQMHAVTLRWLAKPLPPQQDQDSLKLFNFFHGRLTDAKGKMEVSRVGGSNGQAHISKEFLNMLHCPGITPRKSHAVMWVPDGTKWKYLYISPYEEHRKICCRSYCQPLPGGQTKITKTLLDSPDCPSYFLKVFHDYLLVKAESAPLVCALNQIVFLQELGISACEEANMVQDTTNTIARICAKRSKDPEQFYLHLLTTCSVTVLCYATRLHMDVPKKHSLFKNVTSFWENKWVIEVPLLGSHDRDNLALGRGGAGRVKFVFALLDNSYNMANAYGWGNQQEQGNGVLFRELVQAAREFELDGPDAPAIVPVLVEDAIDNAEEEQQQDNYAPFCTTS